MSGGLIIANNLFVVHNLINDVRCWSELSVHVPLEMNTLPRC